MSKLRVAGQNLTEVVLCLAIISAAIAGMSIYIRRSFQARYKAGPDYLISTIKKDAGSYYNNIKGQYEPYYKQSLSVEEKESKMITGFPDSEVDITTKKAGMSLIGLPQDGD